jgi:drug/metabolite transporter (DMT)-like permease
MKVGYLPKVLIGAGYLSLAASIWGAMFIAVRLAVTVIPPVPLVWCRYVTALLLLGLLVAWRHASLRVKRRDWKNLCLVGVAGYTLSIVTQETGTMLTSAQTGSIVTAATPAFMVIFAGLLLHERVTWGRVLSVILATAGVLLIVVDPAGVQVTWLGAAMLILAALTWALMSVLLKLLPGYSPLTITFYGVLAAVILLAPYAGWWLLQADWTAFCQPGIWGSVLYLGFVSTTAGFILWNKGLLYMDASLGGLFMFFQPVVGTFLGWLWLGEPVTSWTWIGTGLVFGGVLLALRGKS